MNTLNRRLCCLALVVALGGCGQARGTGTPGSAVAPSVRSQEPSASPSPAVRPLRDQSGTAIPVPGTYVLDYFPVDLAFDIPDGDPPGWHVGKSNADVGIVLWLTAPESTYGFEFWIADNVDVDPCNAAAGELDPPIGPSVDDLVAALSKQPEFRLSTPVDVTVGAFLGKEIELTALDSADDCPEVIAFRTADDNVDFAPGETLRLRLLDVDGFRIVLYTPEPEEPDAAVEAELQQILDSLRIQPLS